MAIPQIHHASSEKVETVTHVWKLVMSIHLQSQSSPNIADPIVNKTSDMLLAAASALATSAASAMAAAPEASGEQKVDGSMAVEINMMETESYNNTSVSQIFSECVVREAYSSFYLTLLICFVTIGLTASLFVLTVIGWFPDLYSTSKYICQAYSLFTNMVALVMAGFVVLSTFVPSINACNMVLVLVHFTVFLFLSSELLVHLDFYTAIVLPFWHEESVASNENAATFICGISVFASACAAGTLFFMGHLKCDENHPCPIVPIVNMSLDASISTIVVIMALALFGLVFLTCCHIFLIALQKLRLNILRAFRVSTADYLERFSERGLAPQKPANTVVPAAANNLSGTTKRYLVDNGAGVLMYEDDVVSKEVKSAARTPFADPTFLHAIGTTFLERVARNSSPTAHGAMSVASKDDLPPEYDDPKPCSSKDAMKSSSTLGVPNEPLKVKLSAKEVTKASGGNRLILRPPTEEELNKNYEKMAKKEPSKALSSAPTSPATAPRGEGKGDGKEKPEEMQPININEELWKALTKSFRFTLLNIASYGFLLLPSSGMAMIGMGYNDYITDSYAKDPVGQIFLPTVIWRLTMLCFALVRTAQPIILAKMDKTINNKIGVIISDDVED